MQTNKWILKQMLLNMIALKFSEVENKKLVYGSNL